MEGMNEASTGTGEGPDLEQEQRVRRRVRGLGRPPGTRNKTVAEILAKANPKTRYVMVPDYERPRCARLRLLLQ